MMDYDTSQYMSEKRDIELELQFMMIQKCPADKIDKRQAELTDAFNAKWWSINNINKQRDEHKRIIR